MLKSISSILTSSKCILRPSCLLSRSIQKSGRVLCGRKEFLFSANSTPNGEFPNYLKQDMILAAERAKYLTMSLEEKRSHYFCESEFVTLKDIVPWSEHAKKVYPTHEKALYPVNPKLNEKVSIFVGDITSLEIDVIVNAANKALKGGGGVDGAIHRAAGPQLLEECRLLQGCETGNAKMTAGYKLPAKYVIHTVGPTSEDSGLLASCYEKSLMIAKENGLRTIAFPCISTGIYGYRNQKACPVALKTVRDFLEVNESFFDRVIFCLFLPVDVAIYEAVLQEYFPA